MDSEAIYRKTDKGAEAIALRERSLPQRLRACLILVDGKRPFGELARLSAALGDPENLLAQLLDAGLVELVLPLVAEPPPPAPADALPAESVFEPPDTAIEVPMDTQAEADATMPAELGDLPVQMLDEPDEAPEPAPVVAPAPAPVAAPVAVARAARPEPVAVPPSPAPAAPAPAPVAWAREGAPITRAAVLAAMSAPVSAPVPLETAPEKALTPVALDQARRFALRELVRILGDDADLLAEPIATARTEEEMRYAIKRTQVFLRSLRGEEVATRFMSSIRANTPLV